MVAKGFEWLPIATFYLLFVLYLIVSAVLLINLLIAMMGARYGEKMNNAHIDTRVDFGRLVLRLEMLFEITLCRPDIPVNQLPDNDDEEHFSSERSQRGPSDYGEAGSSGTAPDMAHPHTFSAKMRRASATFRSDKSDIKALQNMTCTNIFESDEEPDSDAASPSASVLRQLRCQISTSILPCWMRASTSWSVLRRSRCTFCESFGLLMSQRLRLSARVRRSCSRQRQSKRLNVLVVSKVSVRAAMTCSQSI